MELKAILLTAALLVAAPQASAQHAHGKAPPGDARAELGASAAFGREGELWAVYKEGAHVMAVRSGDAGHTWSAAARVNARPEPVAADGDSRPKVATGPAGEVYVTWTQPLAKPYTGLIRFARSIDGGRSFSAPLTVHTDRREITHRFDALAVNRDGQVFVAWIDKRDVADHPGDPGPYRGAALYFAVSRDRGESFASDARVAHHSCECCRIALLPAADGSVLAFWRHVFEPNIRDHALAVLRADGSATEATRATFDDWRIDACPHHGPSLAGTPQALHAVWYSGTPGREGVRYGRLRPGAVEGGRRIGGETAEHADIAANGARVAIAWREFDGKRSRLRAMRSDDGGESWRESELAASEGATDHPKVLVRGAGFHVLWNTRAEPLLVVGLP